MRETCETLKIWKAFSESGRKSSDEKLIILQKSCNVIMHMLGLQQQCKKKTEQEKESRNTIGN